MHHGIAVTADGCLTSAVSVTSAIEGIGLKVNAFNGNADPNHYRNTNLLSVVVLCLIFMLQVR